jgi:transketolase
MTARAGLGQDPQLEQLAVNTIRFLAADAVEQAKSGHPGMPMGMADLAFVLWTRFLRYNPSDPGWPGRDRFVLSNGHGSMLLYAMLHLAGYDLPMEELKRFRQWGSRTPGHPEYRVAPGVETTTGPLGQGFGNGVGMALAAKLLAARVNTLDFSPVAHRIFGFVSDGDLMEGVSHEAASLAGHLRLGNLIYLYDDNHVSIEGDTAITYSDDVQRRFQAYGWHTLAVDGHDRAAVGVALESALAQHERPSLIACRTHIGYGAPRKQDTASAHGEPLGQEELAAAKRALGWPEEPRFRVPEEVYRLFRRRAEELRADYQDWQQGLRRWSERNPERAGLWRAHLERRLPADLFARLLESAPPTGEATRMLASQVLQKAADLVPALVGGSADLDPSTKTRIQAAPTVGPGRFEGRTFHFGVREHGMGVVLNGLALHGGFIPYGSTFLVFADYMRPPMRLAALSGLQVIYVFTHDSLFLGEDGPTHQPVEQLTNLRAVPRLLVVRPADGPECAAAWTLALERREAPTAIVLSRQKVAAIERAPDFDGHLLLRGGYVLREASGAPRLVLIATGSEVGTVLGARELLEAEGTPARVVSMPAPQLFLEQDAPYRDAVLPPGVPRAAVEAGVPDYWYRFVGPEGLVIGVERFGASAPWPVIAEKLGFTPAAVAARAKDWLRRR